MDSTQIFEIMYLYLFRELFHEDFSPIVRRNTDGFYATIHTIYINFGGEGIVLEYIQ